MPIHRRVGPLLEQPRHSFQFSGVNHEPIGFLGQIFRKKQPEMPFAVGVGEQGRGSRFGRVL